tara:strand:+ start:1039 stop:1329 length:291 start_codon:yes stop_codon:yes gene_type:complete
MAVIETTLDEFGKPQTKIFDSDKTQISYLVRKCRDGFVFYEIIPSAGKLISKLEGKWSRAVEAEKAVLHYLKIMKPTPRTRVIENAKARSDRKAKE